MALTNAQLSADISALIASVDDWQKTYSDWLGGTATGGPNHDGRYPLKNAQGIASLYFCPAALASTVTGPSEAAAANAAAAVHAQQAAEAAATLATTKATFANASTVASQAARDLTLIYKNQVEGMHSNVVLWSNRVSANAATAAANTVIIQGLAANAANSANSASSSASSAANSANAAATFNPANFANVIHTHAANAITTGTFAGARMPAYTGDVTSAAGGTVNTLATVNANVGVFGSGTVSSVLTVNAKGLITAVSTATITPAWTSVTGKPTTISGYGITDLIASITALDAVKLTGTLDPARLPSTVFQAPIVAASNIASLTTAQQTEIRVGSTIVTSDGVFWSYLGGTKTLEASYRAMADTTPEWTSIGNKPSTFTPSTHTHVWSDIVSGKPTTLAGYGITDAVSSSATAASATVLATGRTIGMTGDMAWTSPSFNGSANVTATATLATVNANVGSFGSTTASPTFTVNAKGQITAASTVTITPAWGSISGKPTTIAGYGLTDAVPLSGATLTGALYVKDRLNINGADPYLGSDGPTKSIVIAGGGGWTSTGAAIVTYGISHPSQSGNVLIQASDSGTRAFTVAGFASAAFNVRPTFNGAVPWDSGNFNPVTKADASNWNSATTQAQVSATKGFFSGVNSTSTIANQAGAAALEARAQDASAGAAFMQFHRPGVYATNLGLDADSKLKIGGWSYGATSDHIWHNNNIPTAKDQFSLDGQKRFHFVHSGSTYLNSPGGFFFRNDSDVQIGRLDGAGNFVVPGTIQTQGNGVTIRGGSPTLYFRDTDHRTAMIHVNSNTMHFLRGAGNDSEAWETVNGRWPLTINLENNEASFGGNLRADGGSIYSGSEVYTTNWFRVQGASSGFYWEQHGGGWHMSDSTYLRVYNSKYLYSAGAAGFDGNVNMGSFAVLSDARLKSEIKPLTGHGELIDRLAVKTYIKGGKPEWGVIAQEVEQVEPMLVVRAGDPNGEWGDEPLRTVDTNSLMFAMLAEIKDLRARLALVEGRQ